MRSPTSCRIRTRGSGRCGPATAGWRRYRARPGTPRRDRRGRRALRAGVAGGAYRVPVRYGLVHLALNGLPCLYRDVGPANSRVYRVSPGRLPRTVGAGAAGWRRRLGTSADPELRLAVEDLDPFRTAGGARGRPPGRPGMGWPGGAPWPRPTTGWPATSPGMPRRCMRGLRAVVRSVCPLGGMRGATSRHAFRRELERPLCPRPGDRLDELLCIDSPQTSCSFAMATCTALYAGEDIRRLPVRERPDPRPARAVHGTASHAHPGAGASSAGPAGRALVGEGWLKIRFRGPQRVWLGSYDHSTR